MQHVYVHIIYLGQNITKTLNEFINEHILIKTAHAKVWHVCLNMVNVLDAGETVCMKNTLFLLCIVYVTV